MGWALHFLGTDDSTGPWYLWWSGFASDLGLIAAAATVLWKHNCPVRRCNRIGKFPLGDGSGYFVCSKHHPTGAPSAEDIKEVSGNGQAERTR
jgi:hypothetical protein